MSPVKIPPLITLEEHFFSRAFLDSPISSQSYSEQLKNIPGLLDKLSDLGPLRLESMNTNGISIQVVSHGPGNMNATQCQSANDQLYSAIKSHPKRFAGFAVLPVSDPQASAEELTRCIKELGFVGALIDNHANGTYYDSPSYHALFQTAQDLDVPIYLHPTWPTEQLVSAYFPNNSSPADSLMGTSPFATSILSSGFNWHADVAMHILRLFAAGIFDEFPRLKIVAGHFGEMLPYMHHRIIQLSPRWGERQRKWKQVYDENVWITLSGVWSVDPMATILRNTRLDKVLYSVDYPFARNEDGLRFMRELAASGLLKGLEVGEEEVLERIAWRNTAGLLRLEYKGEERTG